MENQGCISLHCRGASYLGRSQRYYKLPTKLKLQNSHQTQNNLQIDNLQLKRSPKSFDDLFSFSPRQLFNIPSTGGAWGGSYKHAVTPSVVAIAVSTATIIWMMNFHFSLFISISFKDPLYPPVQGEDSARELGSRWLIDQFKLVSLFE